jgi:hypothetical protein
MLTKLKGTLTKITKALGVEVILLPDNQYKFTLIELVLDKKNIRLEKKQQRTGASPEILKDLIDKDIPVYLVLNGRGILHKKITGPVSEDNSLIQTVLPNAKAQDFYIQKNISEKGILVSLIRKETVDQLLSLFGQWNIYCTDFSLGAMPIASIRPFIHNISEIGFEFSGHTIIFDHSGIIVDYHFQLTEERKNVVQVDTEKVEEDFLVAYAAAFSLLIQDNNVDPFIERVEEGKAEFINKLLFTKLSWTVLGFFLLALMVNVILFTSFSSENNELIQKESKYSSMFSEMETLSKEVKEKENFLWEAGWLQSSQATYFADRIAATVPASVRLTEFSINPLDERKSKEIKKELFNTNIIFIKGNCTRPTELNEWLDKIKLIDKITKARLVNYFYDNKENIGSFSLEIETAL